MGVVWTLAVLWDTPNLLCWSSDQQVQLPNTFQKHCIHILGKKCLKDTVGTVIDTSFELVNMLVQVIEHGIITILCFVILKNHFPWKD